MTVMRAKFRITHIDRRFDTLETLYMSPVSANKYATDGLDENNTYAKFSPSGQLQLTIVNPALLGKLEINEEYYLDFTKAN